MPLKVILRLWFSGRTRPCQGWDGSSILPSRTKVSKAKVRLGRIELGRGRENSSFPVEEGLGKPWVSQEFDSGSVSLAAQTNEVSFPRLNNAPARIVWENRTTEAWFRYQLKQPSRCPDQNFWLKNFGSRAISPSLSHNSIRHPPSEMSHKTPYCGSK